MPKQLRTTIPSHKLLWLIKNKIACLPIIYLLLTACHSNTVYHSYQSIPTTGWSKSDTLVYTLPASIPAGTYEMTIGIRHQESYPYRDLWMNISTNVKDTEDDVVYMIKKQKAAGKKFPRGYMATGVEDTHYKDNVEFMDIYEKLGVEFERTIDHGAHNWEYCNRHVKKFLDWLNINDTFKRDME